MDLPGKFLCDFCDSHCRNISFLVHPPQWVPDLKCSFNGTSLVPCGGPPGPQESLSHSWDTKDTPPFTWRFNIDIEKSSNC